MLHPGVRGDNQVAGKPRTDKNQKGGNPVADAAKPFFAEEEKAKEAGLQEKGKNALHGKRLADHAAREFGKLSPIGAELEFHRDAGNHAECKVDAKDFRPETGRAVVVLVTGAESNGFENDDEQREAHGQLRKQIMERYCKSEMKTMNIQSGSHA
jgi:hypothetical protein